MMAWYLWLIDRYPYDGKNAVWYPMKYLDDSAIIQEELLIRASEPNVNIYRLRWNGYAWEYDPRTYVELMGAYRIAQEVEEGL